MSKMLRYAERWCSATLLYLVGGVGYFFDFVDFFHSIILRVIFLRIFLLLLQDDALTSNVQDNSLRGSSCRSAALHFWWEGLAFFGDIFFSCRSSFLIVVLSFLAFCVLRSLTPKWPTSCLRGSPPCYQHSSSMQTSDR